MEEKVIASWKYRKGALDAKTAYLCYLAANLAAAATVLVVTLFARDALRFASFPALLLLTTLYGPVAVEAALAACLAQAIVGSHQVEQWLRLQDTPPVAPPPLTLGDPRLSVPPVRPNLQRYDALLLDANPEEEPDGESDA